MNNYQRNEKIQECLEKGSWYGAEDPTFISGDLTYNPDDAAMETLAQLKPDWFVYHRPFLTSPDEKILYGFAVSSDEWLEVPDGIEIYDNLFIHEEEHGVKTVQIPASLEQICQLQNPFGFYVEDYKVNEENEKFSAYDGILFDKAGEKLVIFPSGRRMGKKDYFQMCGITEEEPDCLIGEYAFFMRGFIKALVLPPWIEVKKNSFYIQNGCGKIIADKNFRSYFEQLVKNGQIRGVEFCYYDQGD